MIRRLRARLGAAARRRLGDPAALSGRIDAHQQWLERIEAKLQPAQLLVDQFHTLAYVSEALPLETFDTEHAGRVVGYRNQHREIPAADAYAYFTDVFRGDAERVRDLQRHYPLLIGKREPVLDVGCGRGELLDVLREAGLEYSGVDTDAAMVERCRRAGHAHVSLADATEHLETLAEGSLGAVVAVQVVEHLPASDLGRFVRAARRILRPDGLLIVETVNPYSVPSFRAFWVDPTHQHLLFPETLLALCRIEGFPSAFVFHPERAVDADVDRFVTGAYAVVASAA